MGYANLYGLAYQDQGSNVVCSWAFIQLMGRHFSVMWANGSSRIISTNTPLGACDLTTLVNGVYELRLTVLSGCLMTETNIQFILDSNLKLGQFSFSQQDLVIPVGRHPLTIIRTSTQFNPTKATSAIAGPSPSTAWMCSLDEVRPGTKDLDGNTFSERIGGGRDVTLTLPVWTPHHVQFYYLIVFWEFLCELLSQMAGATGVNYELIANGNPYFSGTTGYWNNQAGNQL